MFYVMLNRTGWCATLQCGFVCVCVQRGVVPTDLAVVALDWECLLPSHYTPGLPPWHHSIHNLQQGRVARLADWAISNSASFVPHLPQPRQPAASTLLGILEIIPVAHARVEGCSFVWGGRKRGKVTPDCQACPGLTPPSLALPCLALPVY